MLSKTLDFLRKHILFTLASVLCSVWFGTAWLVYRAEHQAQGANITSFPEGVWWGIVTVLTVGYGDRYPVTPIGRFWAGVLMCAGVTTVSILTAKISSYFLEQALLEGRGGVDPKKLNDHFVICGWKDDMHEVLLHILDFNPGLESSELVMVANIQQQELIDSIRSIPRLKNTQVIVGPYWEEVTLRRSVPEKARKVLILADRTPMPNGQVPSVTEVDARTVMTSMCLSHIARGTLVTAEILDSKMDQYLKLASVSEIIYAREYSRLLLGNASGGTGVSNIIFDLLDPKTATVITTRKIDEHWIGQTYGSYKLELEKTSPRSIVIGILENTGNQHTIKEHALRRAQQTPDVAKLVQNLKEVKLMKCNHPVFNPNPEFEIHEGSMAILIETRGAVV